MYENKNLLLLMRHAKSDRGSFLGNDFDRPLNERGHHEPPLIAEQLNNLGVTVEKSLVSTAKRTMETWDLLKQNLTYAPTAVFLDQLYNAYFEDVINVIKEYAKQYAKLLVVFHNPAVVEVCEYLSGETHEFKPAYLAILSARNNNDLVSCLNKPHQFCLEKILVV